MAGYSTIYCVGGLGGVGGADAINPIYFQILIGDADRQWLEVHYFDRRIRPIIKANIVPEVPNDPNALIDACILFYPRHFRQCPLLPKVADELKRAKGLSGLLDFNLGKERIPRNWSQLRQEARPYFEQLHLFRASLEPYKLSA